MRKMVVFLGVFLSVSLMPTRSIAGGVYGPAPALPLPPETGNSTVIDWSRSNLFVRNIANANTVFTFTNKTVGQSIVARVSSLNGTVTWPSVLWVAATAPTQSSSSSDLYTFIYDGSSTFGTVVQNLK